MAQNTPPDFSDSHDLLDDEKPILATFDFEDTLSTQNMFFLDAIS